MSHVLSMKQCALQGQRVLLRQDLNVPLRDGVITSAARLEAALTSIRYALEQGAAVLLMSHLGRPEEGTFAAEASLAPVAAWLSEALGQDVALISDYLEHTPDLAPGQVVLLENVRFNPGEKRNAAALAQRYAALCDVFVMDAFATAHRAQASTHGVSEFVPIACAGLLLEAELQALQALRQPQSPCVAVVGGAKVSSKLDLLDSLSQQTDTLIVGGGIANTFLAAQGHPVGQSLYEPDLVDTARRLLAGGANIPLPVDVVVAKRFAADAPATVKQVADVADDELILDVGPQTAASYAQCLQEAATIIWNGPVGVFEFPAFGAGTRVVGEAIAASEAFSVAGGGDTLAAVEQFALAEGLSYISTGGGAFLSFLEGGTLPAVSALEAAWERSKG